MSLPLGLGAGGSLGTGDTGPVVANSGAITPGSNNDDGKAVFLKHLGTGLDDLSFQSLAAACGGSDEKVWQLARDVYDQLSTCTARGVYLSRKGAGVGVSRPVGVGLPDDLYRALIVKVASHKLTLSAFMDVLEVFYGPGSVRGASTSIAGPFYLMEGMQLTFLVDGKVPVVVTFFASDFLDPTNATAYEVAAAITRAMRQAGCKGYATTFSPPSGGTVVQVVSPSRGLASSIQMTGGQAQNALQFPAAAFTQTVDVISYGVPLYSSWSVTVPRAGVLRFTCSNTNRLDLSSVNTDCYVNIYGENFQPANRGSFPVVAASVAYPSGVLTQSFDVLNSAGVPQSGVLAVTCPDIFFFNAVKSTVYNSGSRAAFAAQHGRNAADVVLPATSPAVQRAVNEAAYLQTSPLLTPVSMSRNSSGVVTATFSSSCGLAVGNQILVDGAVGLGGVNCIQTVASVSLNGQTVTFVTSEFLTAGFSTGSPTLMPFKAPAGGHLGPCLFDPTQGLAVTHVASTTVTALRKGTGYSQVAVAAGAAFPDAPGYLVFGFGTQNEAGPVPYLGKIGANTLAVDFQYRFVADLPAGTDVCLLSQRSPLNPVDLESGAFFLTGSSQGRVAASGIIQDISAAGSTVNINVSYPSDVGLGAAGFPVKGGKLSDAVSVWAGDSVDAEVETAGGS